MMSNQNIQKRISFSKLKAHIEAHPTFNDYIAEGIVHDKCHDFSDNYHYFFYCQNPAIDHVFVRCLSHDFLAVRTSDRGTLIFDPTFKQFYPEYPDPYFLGTPQQLREVIGNADQILRPSLDGRSAATVESSYLHGRIDGPFYPCGLNCLRIWSSELSPIEAKFSPSKDHKRINQTRSSKLVSP